ncbi:MAG: F0F1 ATP synthase subunit alpha [Thermodesulfobacteriota bacterium]
MNELERALREAGRDMAGRVEDFAYDLKAEEVGRVMSVGGGIAWVEGLSRVRCEELVTLGADTPGLVLDILPDRVGVVLLGRGQELKAGDEAVRTGRIADTPVGTGLLGRVVDPLGEPLDAKGPVAAQERWPVQREAPGIGMRLPVEAPLQTGYKVVDALIPVGRGQRELILGDRQTGKTSLAVDAILNQRDKDCLCVYCAIAQRASSVAKTADRLARGGAMGHTVLVVAESDDAPGLALLAPYAAASMAEWFMAQGRDVLVVYDDLTRHAVAYRQISLLLRRPPGREAFPGDIFYLHSRLLERATRLRPEFGGGSVTALPIAETEAQNIAGYIPTNLISITDGQIYLNPDLFGKGVLPAVDVGVSVSRVGGRAQSPAYRRIAGELRLSYSQFTEMEAFARFGTRLDERTRAALEHGRRVREILKQGLASPLSAAEQVAVLLAVARGLCDGIRLPDMPAAEQRIVAALRADAPLAAELAGDPGEAAWDRLDALLRRALAQKAGEA